MLVNGLALGCPSSARLAHVLYELDLHMEGFSVEIGSSDFPRILQWLLERKSAQAMQAIHLLAADGRPHVRADLAAHLPKYIAGVFEMLAHDPVVAVRVAAAGNIHVPTALRKRLREDQDEVVAAVANRY